MFFFISEREFQMHLSMESKTPQFTGEPPVFLIRHVSGFTASLPLYVSWKAIVVESLESV